MSASQGKLDLGQRFPRWARRRYTEILERKLMLTTAALAEEKRRRVAAEKKLKTRWANR